MVQFLSVFYYQQLSISHLEFFKQNNRDLQDQMKLFHSNKIKSLICKGQWYCKKSKYYNIRTGLLLTLFSDYPVGPVSFSFN